MFRKMKIGKRFFLIFFCLSFIPMLVIGVSIYKQMSSIIEGKMSENCISINNGIRGQYNFLFKEIDDYTVDLAYNNQLQHLLMQYNNNNKDDISNYKLKLLILDYLKSKVVVKEDGIIKVGIRLNTGENINYDIDYNNYIKASSPDFITTDIYNQALDANGELIWTSLLKKDQNNLFGYKDTHMAFQVSRTIKLTKGKGESIGVLSIVYSPKILSQVYDELFYNGDIYLVDDEGCILYSNKENQLFTKVDYHSNLQELKVQQTEDMDIIVNSNMQDDIVLTYSRIPDNQWGLIYSTSYKALTKEVGQLSLWLIKASFILLLIAGIATYYFSRTITKPLSKLVNATQQAREGHYIGVTTKGEQDEIAVLTQEFNDMIIKIDDLINQVYVTRLREKDAKLRALQGQINPHFLYNTLDSMRWLAREKGNVDISHRLQILSNLFRIILKDDGVTTTFENEIKYTEYYLFFMLNNHREQLNINWHVDEECKSYKTIKLLIQPIVENAIKHGMYADNVLDIDISIKCNSDDILVQIQDNGQGFNIEQLERKQTHNQNENHIGIGNVEQRIIECFGDEYGLIINSVIGQGTTVDIKLPKVLGRNQGA